MSEAHLLATLSPHPNVVQFLGVCFKPFLIVTEFMSGGSLRALLDVDNVLLDRVSHIYVDNYCSNLCLCVLLENAIGIVV